MTRDARGRLAHAREVDDVLLVIAILAQMLHGYLPDLLHELLGIVLGTLVVWHVMLHRGWFMVLAREHWDAFRAIDTLLVLGCLACLLVIVVSGLVVGDLVGAPMGFGLTALARAVHLTSVHLGFVLMALHGGWVVRVSHAAVLARRGTSPRNRRVATWLVLGIVCAGGVWAFANLGYAGYIAGTVGFALVDATVPAPLHLLEILLASTPFCCAGFALAAVTTPRPRGK